MPTTKGINPSQQYVFGNQSPRVGIIGAGPAGLAAAARLSEAGVRVDLFEASDNLGGLARSIPLWNRQLELSAHIFHNADPFVNRLWQDSAGELVEIKLRRGIFDGEQVIEYPITPLRILRNLGTTSTVLSVIGLGIGRLSQRLRPLPKTAEDWMIRNYGRPLHNRFLRDYAEKLWGLPCNKISASFPRFLFQSADSSQKGEQTFLYPKFGNSSVWNRLGEQLCARGVSIHKQTRVSKLEIINSKVTGLATNNGHHRFDHVISTMPLGMLARLALPGDASIESAAAKLRARSTVLVYLLAKTGKQSKFNWLSVYPANFSMGRITDFGQWLNSEDGNTVYCLEYWCDRGGELWNQDNKEIVALATAELNRTKLLGSVSVIDSHVERLPGTHPVFSLESQSALDHIKPKLAAVDGLSTVGRHGDHGVFGMGESMEAARIVADRVILDLAPHSLAPTRPALPKTPSRLRATEQLVAVD